MINKSYKIWIILFVILNLLLLVWSLGYLKFVEEKFVVQENTIVIEPNIKFKKNLPPKDESFPNEKSKVWGAFEDKQKQEQILQKTTKIESKKDEIKNVTVLDDVYKNKENKSADDEQIDEKPPEVSQILEKKSSSEEKKPKVNLTNNNEQTQNNSKNHEDLKDKSTYKTLVFYVQVASFSKKELVETEWNRFKKKHSKYIKDLMYISQKAELKDKRVFFRLLVGKFMSKKAAINFCDKLNINRCIVKKNNE